MYRSGPEYVSLRSRVCIPHACIPQVLGTLTYSSSPRYIVHRFCPRFIYPLNPECAPLKKKTGQLTYRPVVGVSAVLCVRSALAESQVSKEGKLRDRLHITCALAIAATSASSGAQQASVLVDAVSLITLTRGSEEVLLAVTDAALTCAPACTLRTILTQSERGGGKEKELISIRHTVGIVQPASNSY